MDAKKKLDCRYLQKDSLEHFEIYRGNLYRACIPTL